MPKNGIVYGMESSFPHAVVDRINGKQIPGVLAEHIRLGGIRMAEPSGYAVIIDRISHAVEFYRSYLKNAALNGTVVINNPFWWSADDKFFNYALASHLGIAVPRTAILPQKTQPAGNREIRGMFSLLRSRPRKSARNAVRPQTTAPSTLRPDRADSRAVYPRSNGQRRAHALPH